MKNAELTSGLNPSDAAWLTETFARNRDRFGGWRMDGSGEGGAGGEGGHSGTGEESAGGSDGDKGYPSDTPVAEMTADQRAAYWEHHSKKHESMLKAERRERGNITADELKALREKAKRADDLDYELGSDKDKAVADARKQATDETRGEFVPKLVQAEFRAANAGRLDADQLTALIEDLDLSKFVLDTGEVDVDRIAEKIDALAPAADDTHEGKETRRRGPSPTGSGNRGGGAKPSLDSGRDAYARRHGKTA